MPGLGGRQNELLFSERFNRVRVGKDRSDTGPMNGVLPASRESGQDFLLVLGQRNHSIAS
jgi:hypothetical protein